MFGILSQSVGNLVERSPRLGPGQEFEELQEFRSLLRTVSASPRLSGIGGFVLAIFVVRLLLNS